MYVAKHKLKHNGKTYNAGDEVPLSEKEAEGLVKSRVVELVGRPVAVAPVETPSVEVTPVEAAPVEAGQEEEFDEPEQVTAKPKGRPKKTL